ncbi:hypothetical protein BC936DRAFT_146591 [Jimgerdemannia flammicorona]|uniref:RlpA-like double-psi beta-barrel-protein domain-containing protein-containing protein n=1 Tax=Jimgerdemannia flammicorona TaxID=994334 RepID=A0A433D789_9FUNG|nr:hypothetical protein BC936DRAFT_146591 [Jimgerdemannia flammicorona]
MRYITLLTLAALALAAQTVAQDDNQSGSGKGKKGKGRKGMGKARMTSTSSITTTTKTTKATKTTTEPPKPTPGNGYTVKNAQGTRFGTALNGNACNISGADPAVAVNRSWFKSANPNSDPICGKTVAITNSDGKTVYATAVDECVACEADNHLDMT